MESDGTYETSDTRGAAGLPRPSAPPVPDRVPPAPAGPPAQPPAPPVPGYAPGGHARFMTLATSDGTAPWASTVDFGAPGSRTNL
ncbi:hypothetical protein ACFU5W_29045, partial [Streptomyces laurentii]